MVPPGSSGLCRLSHVLSKRIALRIIAPTSFQSSRNVWREQKPDFCVTLRSFPGFHHQDSRAFTTSIWNAAEETNKSARKYVPPPADADEKSKVANEKPSISDVYKGTVTEMKATIAAKTGNLGVKGLIKKYGIPFAVWYSTLYFGGMLSVYVVLQSGVVSETSVIDWIQMTPVANYIDLSNVDPKLGNFAGAVAINEVLELIRLPFAILTIPHMKAAWDKRKGAAGSESPPPPPSGES